MSAGDDRARRAESLFFRFLAESPQHDADDLARFLAAEPDAPFEEVRRLHQDYLSLRSVLVTDHGTEEGLTFGDYRLVRLLGAGGMGEVWEAWQESLRRRVALKLFPRDSFSPRARERFQREAQAGARLSHPGIVPVYQIGEHDGRAFLVQGLIEGGRTLADHLAELRAHGVLPAEHYRSMAELIASIADALAAAHEVGVLHRDVKPGNILLRSDGSPVVTDFGLARLIGDAELTRTGEIAGTPFYMSPEQASGRVQAVGPRSDVFSLGVTLFECLTLTRPFDGDTSHEILRKILFEDPPDPRRLRARISRDLATVCLKAMEKRSASRYADMSAFAADLRRFLADEPVLARPPGAVARLARWSRRHPAASAAGLVAAVALAVWAFLFADLRAAWKAAQAQSQRATAEAATANRIKDVLVGLFQASDPEHSRGEKRLVEEVLRDGLVQVRSQLEEEPRVRADLLAALGEVHYGMGLYRESEELLNEAIGIQTELLGPTDPKVLGAKRVLAEVNSNGLSRLDEAERLCGEVLAGFEARGEADTFEASRARLLRAEIETSRHRPARAKEILVPLVAERARDFGEDDERTLIARSRLVDALIALEENDAAERELAAIEALRREGRARNRAALVAVLHERGRLLALTGRSREALEALEESVELADEIYGPDQARSLLATSTLASVRLASGQIAEAEEAYARVLEHGPAIWGASSLYLRQAHTNLGILAQRKGDLAAMEDHFRRAVEIAAQLHPQTDATYLRCLGDLATGLSLRGKYDEAAEAFDEAIALQTQSLGPSHPTTLQARINLAILFEKMGEQELARLELEEVLPACRTALGRTHRLTLTVLENLADSAREDAGTAAALYEEAIQGWRSAYSQEFGLGFRSVWQLAGLRMAEERYGEAADLIEEELERSPVSPAEAPPLYRALVERLAEACSLQGRTEDAEEGWRRLAAIGEAQGDAGRGAIALAENRIGRLRLAAGEVEAATAGFRRALELEPRNPVYRRDLEALGGDPTTESSGNER